MDLARTIYFQGPKIFGFWNGIEPHDACSELTKVSSSVWIAQQKACSDLLNREFVAYGIGVSVVLGLLGTWKLANYLVWSSYLRQLKSIVPECQTCLIESAIDGYTKKIKAK